MGRVLGFVRHHALAVGAIVAAVALSGTAAYAGTLIGSRQIKNDSIKTVDLNFPVGQSAATLASPVTLTTGKFETVLTDKLRVSDGGGTGTGTAAVEVVNNTGKGAANVDVRLIHVGYPDHTKTFTTRVPDGATISVPAGLLCDGMPAGANTVRLDVRAPIGVDVTDATLAVAVEPSLG